MHYRPEPVQQGSPVARPVRVVVRRDGTARRAMVGGPAFNHPHRRREDDRGSAVLAEPAVASKDAELCLPLVTPTNAWKSSRRPNDAALSRLDSAWASKAAMARSVE